MSGATVRHRGQKTTLLTADATEIDGRVVRSPPSDRVVVEDAPAKVNLFLHVTGRRDDGYHLLDSLVVFPPVGDTVRVARGSDGEASLNVEGPFAHALDACADNLVLRAMRDFAAAAGQPARARLVLEKRLPVASGIGGGSADAAATLRALARLWDVAVAHGVALRLGADVPVCVAGTPSRMRGVGEVLTDVPPLPSCGIVLLNCGVAVPTQSVFSGRVGDFSGPASIPSRWRDTGSFVAWLAGLRNDLERPALSLFPAIGETLARLRAAEGCLLARMSGSGGTCFGLFATAGAARLAAQALGRPGWWSWGGAIAGLPTRADAT